MVAIIRKKLIKVMNTELGIDRTLLGDQYIGQVLSVISIRFVLAGLMTLIFAMCIGQNILKVTKKQWDDVVLMGLVSTTAAYFFFNIGNVNIRHINYWFCRFNNFTN